MTQIPAPIGSLWAAKTYTNGTATSTEAARSARDFSQTQAGLVLACITEAEHEGCTMHEVSMRTGVSLQSVCARVAALRESHLITATHKTRRTPSGRSAVVWCAAGLTTKAPSRPENPAH
jgi:hypothetical protein